MLLSLSLIKKGVGVSEGEFIEYARTRQAKSLSFFEGKA